MHTLQVFLTSTRPGRAGEPISRWFVEHARAHGTFEVSLVDLKAVNLPPMDEPKHPRLRQYEHAHTKAWSAAVDAADAFVFVLPEYNYCMPPAFVNALDFLMHEWAYKPAGIVSYGGVSAGLRSAQQARQLVTALRMMPLPDAVSIPMFQQFMDAERNFLGNAILDKSIVTMLDELERWASALEPLRAKRRVMRYARRTAPSAARLMRQPVQDNRRRFGIESRLRGVVAECDLRRQLLARKRLVLHHVVRVFRVGER